MDIYSYEIIAPILTVIIAVILCYLIGGVPYKTSLGVIIAFLLVGLLFLFIGIEMFRKKNKE